MHTHARTYTHACTHACTHARTNTIAGDLEAAAPLFKEALEVSKATLGERHPLMIASQTRLDALNRMQCGQCGENSPPLGGINASPGKRSRLQA